MGRRREGHVTWRDRWNPTWGLKCWGNNVRSSWTEELTFELNDSMIRMSRKGQGTAQDKGIEMLKHSIYKGTQNQTAQGAWVA